MRHTRLICLIGDPVEHSISPILHNELFKMLGLNYVYVAFRVSSNDLHDAVRGLRALGVTGFNVTIPHKVAVVSYLDKLSDEVRLIGAVNTVVNVGKTLVGYNTDYLGVMNTFRQLGVGLRGCNVTVLGAGGACRAVVYALLVEGVSNVYIVNRSPERARDLARDFKEIFTNSNIIPLELNLENLRLSISKSHILINTTPVGMYPRVNESLVPPELIDSDLVVMDLVYNPVMTKLLRDAKARGARVIDGVYMLVHQAAASFKLWTGVEPPVDYMLSTAYSVLGGSNE